MNEKHSTVATTNDPLTWPWYLACVVMGAVICAGIWFAAGTRP